MTFYQPGPTRPTIYCTRCAGVVAAYQAPLTEKQARLLAFIRERITEREVAPSFEEIAAQFGYHSLATVHEHLRTLERKGYITRRYNESRAISLIGAA